MPTTYNNVLFNDGRKLLGKELNEVQAQSVARDKSLLELLYGTSKGVLQARLTETIGEVNSATVTGKVFAFGTSFDIDVLVEQIYASDITVDTEATLYAEIAEKIVTGAEDSTLLHPTLGIRTADRIKYIVTVAATVGTVPDDIAEGEPGTLKVRVPLLKVVGNSTSEVQETDSNIKTYGELSSAIESLRLLLSGHADNKDNPHEVTKKDIELDNVTNVKQASEADFITHRDRGIHLGEVHGIRLNQTTNLLEFFDGQEWNVVSSDETKVRDSQDTNLRVRVSNTPPASGDGRIYYNTVDKFFYVSRDGQWWRLFVGGDVKLDRVPPSTAPQLESKTDVLIKLIATAGMEYKYLGGDWQESGLFTGLSRSTSYTFYSRYSENDTHKASPESPGAVIVTDKGTQVAPAAPVVSAIEHNKVVITGEAGTEVRIGSGAWYSSPYTATGLTPITDYTAYARRKETTTHLASPSSVGRAFKTGADNPGPNTIIGGGNAQAGYYGLVPASELITGDALATLVGLSAGVSQFSTTAWMKFAFEGKIEYVPQKPIRHTVSWDQLNAAGLVAGKVVTIGGRQYKVRLMRGALTDPSAGGNADRGAHGSEWNKLMLPIHEQAATKAWAYPAYVEANVPNWGIGFTDAVLLTHNTHGNGSYTWCKEVYGPSPPNRVLRGYNGVSYSDYFTSSLAPVYYGWRPVLELL